MRVLLVDDSAVVCRMIRALLAATPTVEVVGEVRSAEDALDRLAQHPADLVVMDWSMPGMNGIDATAAVRRRWPQTMVVGFTSTADAAVRAGFLSAGAAAVFTKDDAAALRQYLVDLSVAEPE